MSVSVALHARVLRERAVSWHEHYYTLYIKDRCWSRVDRMYIKEFYSAMKSCEKFPVGVAERSIIPSQINAGKACKTEKGLWKLNCEILIFFRKI